MGENLGARRFVKNPIAELLGLGIRGRGFEEAASIFGSAGLLRGVSAGYD